MNLKLFFSLVLTYFTGKWYKPEHLNSNKLQEQIADLISRKESLNTQYVSFKQEIKELELIHQNLSKYLKRGCS